jgi:tRNA A37 threonylcarbamoyladenosine modification protein TsaB
MYKIYVDTSNRTNKTIHLRELVGKEWSTIDSVEGDFDPAVEIFTLLQKHNLKPQDISEFVPFLGPGSFTGLKNGVTLCNILNWALGNKSVDQLPMPNYGSEPNIQPPSK